MGKLTLMFMALGLFFGKSYSFSSGAPKRTCLDITPRHPSGSLQNSPSPYEVLATAGQGRVRLILGSRLGQAYQGFVMVAKDIENGEHVGQFVGIPEGSQGLECTPGIKNAVTHVNKTPKQNLEFDWEAPEDYVGTIIFNSTFAQDYATYWVGVESPRVDVLRRSIDVKSVPTPAPPLRTTTPPIFNPSAGTGNSPAVAQDPFYDGCLVTKNCFGTPEGCLDKKNCQAVVSVLVRGERYLFELQAKSAAWVGVGLSNDNAMGSDSVVECVNNGSGIGLHMSWNTGRSNARIPTPSGAVQLDSGTVTDNTISCKFWREKLTTVQQQEFNLVTTPYNLLIAAGSSLKANGVGYHTLAFQASDGARLLSDIGSFAAASDILIRVHGALMLAAWIGTASIGMLLARYYKQTWVNSQLCGKDQWFAWHRFFMVLTWALTIASFVIIFVQVGTWSSFTTHASFGLATTIFCFIQPFMAALRPHPGTPKRVVFNWAHWFVGNAAHICGIIALFLVVPSTKAQLPEWVSYVLAAYVIFHVLSHVVLTFAGCASDRQASHRINSFPMKDMHSRSAMSHPDARRDAPQSGLRKTIFGIYFIIISAFSAVLIVSVVLAPIAETWNTLTGGATKTN